MRLTKPQESLLGWIARRDEGGKGVGYLPLGNGNARIMVSLLSKGLVEIRRGARSGRPLAWRLTSAGRSLIKEPA